MAEQPHPSQRRRTPHRRRLPGPSLHTFSRTIDIPSKPSIPHTESYIDEIPVPSPSLTPLFHRVSQELLRQYSILGSGSGMDPPPPEPPTPHVIMDIHIPSRADIIRGPSFHSTPPLHLSLPSSPLLSLSSSSAVVGHVSGGFFHVLSHVVCGLVLRLLRHVPFLRHLGRPSWC